MKLAIALIAAIVAITPACAADNPRVTIPGHHVWVMDPVIGPKSAPPTHHQVWIADRQVVAKSLDAGPGHWVSIDGFRAKTGAPTRRMVWIGNR